MKEHALPPRTAAIEKRLSLALNGSKLGQPCYAFEQLPSTMDVAHYLANQGAPEGACVWAERQTAGRGRQGRQWASPPGGLYVSIVLRPTRSPSELPQLALAAGLATVQAVHELTNLTPTICWPNDVLLHERKLAGILVEAKSSASSQMEIGDVSIFPPSNPKIETSPIYAAVGIGINVTTDLRDLPEGATSLAHEVPGTSPRTGSARHFADRFGLAAALFRHLEQVYQRWNDGGFTAIRLALIPWIGLFGRLVHISTAHGALEGQALDLDDSGRLLVRLDSGIVRAFEVGEVTLLR